MGTENYSHRKGEGCTFSTDCGTPVCRNGSTGFITSDFKAIGYCGTDANGCAKENKYSNRDCMKGSDWGNSYDKFGASYGGSCALVEGEFKAKDGSYVYTQSKVSVQARCSSSMSSYVLTFKNFERNSRGSITGDANVTCTSSGNKRFNTAWSSYPSTVRCQDPRTFCRARFGSSGSTCDETCVANGRCQRVGGSSYGRRMSTEQFIKDARRELGYFDDWCTSNGYSKSGSSSSSSSSSSSGRSSSSSSSSSSRPSSSSSSSSSRPSTRSSSSSSSSRGSSSASGSWQCWCYSDGRRRNACPSLSEDRDGEGY